MKKEILIVDDSWTTLVLLEWFLIENGYTAILAQDVEKAIDYLKFHTPNLIFLDLQLPKISGFDFLKIAKKKNLNIPILVISANDSSESISMVKELGAADFMAKPFKLNDLLNKVEELINAK